METFQEELHEPWKTCNAIILSWIMNIVSEELLGGIVEIATLSQGSSSVSAYFSKLKELWHEYDVMIPSPNCGCPKSKEHVEHLHRQRVMQFLSGFNDSYDQARR
ncbi:uncharacterized protein LOC142171900 [Nicotiana tabacum]|uniref:Uncharacterized protein LOC142171900 n=1 Tax=Nicotiana tabacum TaxID=4097 RepID=A0AC58T3F0_TOBAC